MIYLQCYQWPSPAAVHKSLEEVFGRTRSQRLSMIDSKTVRGGEARGEHTSMRLLLQGFPAREMLLDCGTDGRMSVVHPLSPSRWRRRFSCRVCVTCTAPSQYIQRHSGGSSSSRVVSDHETSNRGKKVYSSASTGDRSALRLASPREQRGP